LQCGPARVPVSLQMATFSTSGGMRYHSGFEPFVAALMNRAQAGTATVPANPSRMIGAG
jgi:hypothetical protein